MVRSIRKYAQPTVSLDEIDFLDLTARLQEHPDNPGCKRIEGILEALDRLHRDADSLAKRLRASTQLRRELNHYRWVRRVVPQKGRGFVVVCFPAEQESLSRDEAWEYAWVGWILHSVPGPDGRPRIRRCGDDACKKWFFAKRSDTKFCSGNCKQHHHDSDEARKESKREYMRSRRASEKKHAKNPKSGVGLGRTRKPRG